MNHAPSLNLGIVEQNRVAIAQKLNELLSNEYVLYTKTLKYHWNVQGKHFGALHLFFKEQYETLFIIVDDIAERARALGVYAFGTLGEFSKSATVQEDAGKNPDDLGMIAQLLFDHETIIRQSRTIINFCAQHGDEGTANMLTEKMEQHEKMAWMLRAHLGQ